MKFCQWLEAKITERGLSKSKLADLVGCSRSTVSLWISGDRKYPSEPLIKKLVSVLSQDSIALKTQLILELWEVEK